MGGSIALPGGPTPAELDGERSELTVTHSNDTRSHDSSESTRNTRRSVLAATGAIGTGLLAGCIGGGGGGSGGGNGSGGGGGGMSMRIGYQPYYAESWSSLIIKHAGLADKHLPDGYSVEGWEIALQGSVVGNRMIAGKNQVGYTGDMPTITAIASDETAISAVGVAGFSNGQQCNLAIVPSDSNVEVPSDLNGKTFGVTTGSCTHRFMLRMVEQEGIDYEIKDQGINSILAGVRQGSLGVGFGWEPVMNRVVSQEGEGRYVLSGAEYDLPDAAGIIMPDSLIENHPEAAKGWMKAELEAKHIMRSDHERTLDLVAQESELSDYDRSTLRNCLYENLEINPEIDRLEFVTDYGTVDAAGELLRENAPQFLKNQGIINEVPGDERYKLGPLDDAVSELEGSVEWTPAGGRQNGGGNATGSGSGNASANASGNGSGR
jgi:ABC-type nitrate/sulfonate/bicarbonate transport system substrate-binding protein